MLNLEVVKLLISLCVDINKARYDGYTPCWIACCNSQLEIVNY
jgi:hypothetical protein